MLHRLTLFAFVAVLIATMISPPSLTLAQDSNSNWRADRVSIDRRLAEELQDVSIWCRSEGMIKQAEQTLALYKPRDARRQYIFIPREEGQTNSGMSTVTTDDPRIKEWSKRIKEARANHAKTVFQMAKQVAGDGEGALAFQMLHEVLHFDPDHEEVRAILGHKKTAKGWRVNPDQIKARKGTKNHSVMNWKAKQYLRVSSAHFEIASSASEEETIELARKLERWHEIWRQVCFDYWSSAKHVQRWIDGRGKARIPSKRFNVVFFKDKSDYVDQLKNSIRGIEGSTGYYSDKNQTSFFYASKDESDQTTWRHELTHQLFQESIRAKLSPFEDEFLWLVEGIAMYFESVADFGSYATVGGFESRRVQFARIRMFRERFYRPMASISSMNRVDFQSNQDVKRLYSQSAGIAHMLMDAENGKYQRKLIDFLKLLYVGKLKPGTFEKIMGQSYDSFDREYQKFLRVEADEVAKYLSKPETRTELSVPASSLNEAAFQSIGRCKNLTWIDLTANRISGKEIRELLECTKLQQLFLTNCALDPSAFRGLAKMYWLTELDLSGTNATDSMMALLHNRETGFLLKDIAILRLTNSEITDTTLLYLRERQKLRILDVRGTGVTQGGINRLKAELPKLEVKQ